jgi:hypothetical protein
MGAWGRRHTRPSKELSVRAELLERSGPPLWNAFMEELRYLHLGAPRPQRSVFAELQSAYERALARRARRRNDVFEGAGPNAVAETGPRHAAKKDPNSVAVRRGRASRASRNRDGCR